MSLKRVFGATTALTLCGATAFAQDTTITIATVNNGDMIRIQGYTDQFTAETGIAVEWVTVEENVLRQRVTTDTTTRGGQFDIMTIGMYEAPIWGSNGWLVPLDNLSEDYNVDDILAEHLGSDTFLHVHDTGLAETITVRATGEIGLRHGDVVSLAPREDLVHRFDAEGLRIA